MVIDFKMMSLKNNTLTSWLLPFVFMLIISCSERGGNGSNQNTAFQKEDLVRANQFLAGKNMELINAYINRRGWDMEFTRTGLGYQIYENGEGPKVEKGRVITMEYTLSLLDGRVCYSSAEDGPKIFRAGQGGVEAGLEEGVLMLRQGDKARFILPPFLAHGLLGDQNRIPSRAILIYELEVVDVSEI